MGAKIITFDDLDLAGIPEIITQDKLWLKCMELALRGRARKQRWGALVIVNGKVVAEDRNRQLGKGEVLPIKSSFMLHAERAAIAQAIKNVGREGIRGGVVFVAGFLVAEKRPLVRKGNKPAGACRRCSVLYPEFGLSVAFPSEFGWITVPGKQAHAIASKNAVLIRARGISATEYRKSISL